MPVRKMTAKEAEEIFGSGLIIIGLGRPTRPAFQHPKESNYGQVSRLSEIENGQEDIRVKGMSDPSPSVKPEDEH